ncbi:MAG: hypothetical protein GY708_12980 [Actinomycetia bacterium]|nr:hypothetical protein [Actinomycetes bacterium]
MGDELKARLRSGVIGSDNGARLEHEAADEIERLEAMHESALKTCDRYDDEIGRLRAALVSLSPWHKVESWARCKLCDGRANVDQKTKGGHAVDCPWLEAHRGGQDRWVRA